jgi:hypothetical protein
MTEKAEVSQKPLPASAVWSGLLGGILLGAFIVAPRIPAFGHFLLSVWNETASGYWGYGRQFAGMWAFLLAFIFSILAPFTAIMYAVQYLLGSSSKAAKLMDKRMPGLADATTTFLTSLVFSAVATTVIGAMVVAGIERAPK